MAKGQTAAMSTDGTEQATTIDGLEQVWSSMSGLADELDERDWATPTDCPGWTVKDQFAHVSALESQLAGRPQPDHQAPDAPWVRNDFGRITEVGVDYRRPWTPAEVVAEFRELTGERVAQLRALTADEWAADSWTPVGPGTYGLFMAVRIVDCWAHEQDARRAVGRPGHLEGPVPEGVIGRLLLALPLVVAKRAGAPDGTTFGLRLTGPVTTERAVTVEAGRGRLLDEMPARLSAALTMGSETYVVLAMGRQPADDRTDIGVEGDAELANAVLINLNTMQ
jgi:uncharacterized protein (TIGR03083 family)